MPSQTDLGTVLNVGFHELFRVSSLDRLDPTLVIKNGQALIVRDTGDILIGDGNSPVSLLRYSGLLQARKTRIRSLLNRLNPKTNPVPAFNASSATLTNGATRLITNRTWRPDSSFVTLNGGKCNWDPATAKFLTSSATISLDMIVSGSTVEVSWIPQVSNTDWQWVWIDNVPMTAGPTRLVTTTSAGVNYYSRIVLPDTLPHRVTVYFSGLNALGWITTPFTSNISPVPVAPQILYIGDSFTDFGGETTSDLQSYPNYCSLALGATTIQRGIGGTGWNTAQPYSSRLTGLLSDATVKPEHIHFLGSVNDSIGSPTTIAALSLAVKNTLDSCAVIFPNVPVTVAGPQATNAVDTISAGRLTQIQTVLDVAKVHPAVIATADLCGIYAGIPSAYNAGTTYSTGNMVTHLGSVWQLNNGTSTIVGSAPQTSPRWQLVTWDLTGTGNTSGTTGDGSRDVYLTGSDGVHPTLEGSKALAWHTAQFIHSSLVAASV